MFMEPNVADWNTERDHESNKDRDIERKSDREKERQRNRMIGEFQRETERGKGGRLIERERIKTTDRRKTCFT